MLTGLSLQEYQHVHLLCFKKRSFTLVWKPNPPSAARTFALVLKRGVKAQWARAAPALHMRRFCAASALLTRAVWNQALLKRSRWKRLSSHDQWNLSPATMCCSWQHALYEADALEQRRPCTRTSATTSNFYSHTLKKWSHFGRSLEPCKAHCSSVCACVWWAQERVCVLTEVPVNVTGGDCQEILKLLLEGVKPVELVEGMVTGAVACGVTVTLIYCSLYGPAIMTGLYVCNNHFDSI